MREVASRNCASSARVIGFAASKLRVEWRSRRSCGRPELRFRTRRGERGEVDLPPGPGGPHRRQRRHHGGIGISPTHRISMPAFGRARVEQEIVKVPQHEVAVSLGRAQIARLRGIDREEDAAIGEQREQRVAQAAILPAERLDRLRRGEPRDAGRDLRVANPKQRTGARRFEHEVVGTPPQVGEARQHQHVGLRRAPAAAANSRASAARSRPRPRHRSHARDGIRENREQRDAAPAG